MLGNGHVIAKGNLAQKQAETGDHKTESHERDAGSDPRQECAFGGQINPWISWSIVGLIHSDEA